MNRRGAIAVLILLLLPLPVAQVYGRDNDPAAALEQIARQIETEFPLLEGTVVESRSGGELIVDLKQGQAVKPGDRLQLLRFGQELTHPTTGEKLGREETDLGQVEILEVRKNFSRAKALQADAKPQKGDGVRAQFRKLHLIVAPLRELAGDDLSGRMLPELERALNANPRFHAVPFDFKLWLLETGLKSDAVAPEHLRTLRAKTGADFILFASMQPVKEQAAVEYRLQALADGAVVKQARLLSAKWPAAPPAPSAPAESSAGKAAVPPAPREQAVQEDFRRESKDLVFVGKQGFPFTIVDFDVGDVNGDGVTDYVIIDAHRVMIYNYVNNQFKLAAQRAFDKGDNKFLSVDVADLNGNGKSEIFITNKRLNKLSSFVLEARQKSLQTVWENVNLYFRVLRPFGAKPVLITQKPGYQAPFAPGMRAVEFKDGQYAEGQELAVPDLWNKPFIVYGFNQADINSGGGKDTIILDKDYHLRVYSPTGQLLVKSDEYFGHDPRAIDVGITTEMGGLMQHGEPVNYRGRLLLEQQGGKRFLIAPKNYLWGSSLFSGFIKVNGGSVAVFGVSKEGVQSLYETKKQKGYVAAFQVAGAPQEKERKIHVAVIDDGGGGKMNSFIYTYNWNLN